MAYSPELEGFAAGNGGADVMLVHQHSLWTGMSRVTLKWSARYRRPTIISAHGALQDLALRRSSWKKRIALFAYERENLSSAACLHALSAEELLSYREFGLQNPVAVIPNGITSGWMTMPAYPEAFRRWLGLRKDARVMLFLSRITPIKGLLMLAEALSAVRCQLDSWRLVIAGPDEFHHEREVRQGFERFGLSDFALFVGPLFGQQKRDAFAAADLFVLPSLSEGAPVVILEALGAGVAVLTTKACPWPAVASERCGWRTEVSTVALARALGDALSRSRAELVEMGRRGRELVRTQYMWSGIAKEMTAVYGWVLGMGARPACVDA